jgi:arylsulfatase A-like enzyme
MPPHIVIFNPDQWRGDVLGHLGNRAAVTPHLDRMVATDAVSFRNAFCQNPVCTPSRCSFMTSWYPHVRGHRTMFHMLRQDEPVLLKTLKENGYFFSPIIE